MKKIYTLLLFISISFTGLIAQIEGTWKIAPQAQALAVGPGMNDFSWWSSSAGDVNTRACFFDDQFKFNADGSFENIQGGETWLEPWQGVDPEACGAPIAPHDGSNAATWTDNGSSITITGVGAHLGLAKVFDTGELGSPGEAPGSITYPYVIDGDIMTIDINYGGAGGGWWHFVLQKEGAPAGDAQSMPLTFEDAGTDYEVIGFGEVAGEIITNPDANGENTSATVAQLFKPENAEVWGGATFPLSEVIDFSASTMIELKFWSPRADVPVLLKIEDTTSPPDANGNPSVIAEVIVNTTVANAWELLTFDMSTFGAFDASIPYNQVIVFGDFNNAGVAGGETFYVDNIGVLGSVAIDETELAKVKMTAYPNPADQVLNVNFDIPVSGNVTLTLVDVLGRTAQNTILGNINAGVYTEQVSVNRMAGGAYVLLLRLDGQLIKTQNIVVR